MVMKKTDQMLGLNDVVRWWVDSKEVRLQFVPRELKGGTFIPCFDYVITLNGMHIRESGLIAVMNSDLYDLGYTFTNNQLYNGVRNWIWNEYGAWKDRPEFVQDIVRVVIRRKPGRPRKDKTTRTIIVKHVE